MHLCRITVVKQNPLGDLLLHWSVWIKSWLNMYNKAPQSYGGGECGKRDGTDIFYGYQIVDNPISVRFNPLIGADSELFISGFLFSTHSKTHYVPSDRFICTLTKRIWNQAQTNGLSTPRIKVKWTRYKIAWYYFL